MRLLLLHLSDAHLNDENDLHEIHRNAIVRSLSQVGAFDECSIVFSGDIAYSGQKQSYQAAGKLVGCLAKSISSVYLNGKHVNILVVPGNHDNLVENPERDNKDLERYYDCGEEESRFFEDLKQLENFYSFASNNNCFVRDKVIDVKTLTYDGFSIRFNLVNTAAFSLLGNGNRDKGLHYIPKNKLKKLDESGRQRYTITVLHHSPEWFSDPSKHKLYDSINANTDLLLVGHEHFGLNETKKVNGEPIDISSGIALYGTDGERGFNAILLDTEAHSLSGYKYVYTDRFYKPEKVLENSNVVFNTNSDFKISSDFQHELVSDTGERDGENYTNYFVFPSLEVKDVRTELKSVAINDIERFLEVLQDKKKIAIEGGIRTGKTILSKHLASKLLDDYTVIYLNEESFGAKKSRTVLANALSYEYGGNADIDEFLQLPVERKVLVVDGRDKIKSGKWDEFFKAYGDQFEYVITFGGMDWNLNIKDSTFDRLTDTAFYRLKICPFYYMKREELIKKICEKYACDDLSLNVIEKSQKINEEITNQIKFFQLTPDFIHQFVDYYLEFSHIKTQNDTNVFSKVFSANITYRISNNTREEADVDEILVALDYVAHYMHFCKRYQRISFSEFEQAVNEYKERFDNSTLSVRYVYDVAIKSNIMRESSDSFEVEFCDENLLAYFVAQNLNRSCQRGENPQDLKAVLDEICFGINGDILLFLSYITSNTQILNPILHSIFEHMDEWEELDLDTNNVEYLSRIVNRAGIKAPEKKDKEHVKKRKNEIEKEIIEEKNSQADSLYSYDVSKVNSFSNKIAKSINYLQLVAKILPSFRHILTGDDKKVITQILYSYPNKLLYFMLKDIDKNYNKIIEDILREEPKTRKGLLITEDMINRELQNQSIAYILSIYDAISMTAATSKTIVDLDKFEYEANTNYRIQNLMMQENVANFGAFVDRAESIYDSASLDITKQMVTLIVRKYFLFHEVEQHGEAMHVVDKFFGSGQRKNLQIQQARNMVIKK